MTVGNKNILINVYIIAHTFNPGILSCFPLLFLETGGEVSGSSLLCLSSLESSWCSCKLQLNDSVATSRHLQLNFNFIMPEICNTHKSILIIKKPVYIYSGSCNYQDHQCSQFL